MLKILFFLLLLINGGLLAFQQGYLDSLLPASHEPTRLTQQLNADKLQLVPTVEDAKPAAPAADEPAAGNPPDSAGLEKIVAHIDQGNNQGSNPGSGIMACTEVGNFDAADAKRFETRLAALSLGERVKRLPLPDVARHIVYIPPLASREAADRKAGELRHLGVQDFFVIQDNSPLQWGISLGVFKSEEAARKQLADLQKKGVRSARVGDHGAGSSKFVFQLRALDAAGKSSLHKTKADFPRQEMRACMTTPSSP
jgi:hypothetical protein